MKLLLYTVFAFSGLFLGISDVGDEVATALRQGKVADLVKHFDERVSIKILNQEDVLSKAQAEANLRNLFDKHTVKSFSSSHKSSVNNSSQYITGMLETGSGRFRVSILIRRNLVSQFRIETDNE